MQFRVVVPPNVKPGQTLRIRCPDGTEGDVKVPSGLKPGNSFIFEMPSEALINNGIAPGGGGGMGGSQSDAGGSSSLRRRGGSNQARSGGSDGGSGSNAQGGGGLAGTSFLDREIVDRQDFLTALAVGMLIGLSIVAGFLVGVLLATKPT